MVEGDDDDQGAVAGGVCGLLAGEAQRPAPTRPWRLEVEEDSQPVRRSAHAGSAWASRQAPEDHWMQMQRPGQLH